MTVIELIVVLSIFAVLSSVILFNYTAFQSRVDIQNLANDMTLQIVNAQNSALDGLLPANGYVPDNPGYPSTPWRPSYGVYFSSTTAPDLNGADNKDFISFIDLNNNNNFNGSNCQGECLSDYGITKSDYISDISIFYGNSPTSIPNLTVTFARPNSGAALYSNGVIIPNISNVSYIQITVLDPTGKNPSYIDIYPSGRVQIN